MKFRTRNAISITCRTRRASRKSIAPFQIRSVSEGTTPCWSSNGMATPNLAQLEKKIRFKFENSGLLEEAMTHKSYSIEHATPSCNERLEFLGDSIIAAVVANWLFERFPN